MTVHHRGELRLALDHAIQRVNRGPSTLRGPPESKPVFNRSDMHDHDRPGVFLQLQGSTDFTFPREKFWLGADEICVIPEGGGGGHAETVQPGASQPFFPGG